jgi:hypothetical protein
MKICPVEIELRPAGRTDIYGEAYSRFLQFFESAQ